MDDGDIQPTKTNTQTYSTCFINIDDNNNTMTKYQ